MSPSEVTLPKGSWVLVTGANGFVASHVAKQFLERGYKVRGTVRDLKKSAWLVDDVFKTYAEKGDFELVVADLTADNAFDEAIKGIHIVQHVASVVTFDADPNNVIPQTLKGVTILLEAAAREPSVKVFVYTSSIVAATMPAPGNTTHVERDTWNDTATQLAWAPPPYEASRGGPVYMASKVAAEKAVWNFVKEQNPHFTVNVVAPSAILGEPLNRYHSDSPASWLKLLYDGKIKSLSGMEASKYSIISYLLCLANSIIDLAVDVKDVALLHVAAALDPEVRGARIQAWANYINWDNALAIMRELYPKDQFADDYVGDVQLSITTDQTEALVLLKKWGNQEGWKTLRETVANALSIYTKWYPRK
jgi:nucleoside-diphosphate-sugar epimerase